ncbi:MAG: Maf family protein [Clostridiaceae bacterium]|nr:Maf family protein [Clostridiaceae bacterium]
MADKPQMPLILASASPRRRALLERFWGADRFTIAVPRFDENQAPASIQADPMALARFLPAGKIDALREQMNLPDICCVVAADTMVVHNGMILGKPVDEAHAAGLLRQLSGDTHEVLTGLCLAVIHDGQVSRLQAVEQTTVHFTQLDEKMIQWYLSTGEPMDKAGAYGIQGYGAAWIERIDGCYYNVMGLPVFRLMDLLRQAAERFSSIPGLSDLVPWNGSILR